jgi:hypothetical protein
MKQILVGYGLIEPVLVLVLLVLDFLLLLLLLLAFFPLFALFSILGYGKGLGTSGMETLMTTMIWDLEWTLGLGRQKAMV